MINKLILTPFQKFVKIEAFSGIFLFLTTLLSLLWANSSYGDSFSLFWNYKVGFSTEGFELSKPLILWVNDGLMTIFFFLIGLEIKREVLIGELNSVKKITFPFLAALGGMLFPTVIFFLLNKNPETSNAWGVPMATDIAFSLAILKILGNRIPLSLKILVTAFAIVDDLGAVIVIALFYSSGIEWHLIMYALVLLSILAVLSYKGLYSKYLLCVVGIAIWLLFLKSGLHPTIAGVLLAFTVPARQKINVDTFTQEFYEISEKIKISNEHNQGVLLSKNQIAQIDNLEDLINKFQSPLQNLEHRLHNWVAYLIMPIFALSNSGINLSSGVNLDYNLIANIAIALIFGNCIGVFLLSFLGIKLKILSFPKGVNHRHILGISFLAGIGFTMSIFIANLAFSENFTYIDSAKIGILIGSVLSGIIGYLVLRIDKKKKNLDSKNIVKDV